ncbi:MAG: replication-associated recombination protein A [Ignavibacteria bacterium]|jgi:putative ATPase|nr:replication-associated recombination protein A [Ignavibacteria bacterium]MDH7528910.1 replication-associated recombination protein A [Ignavibacteria bacterium]
MIPLAERVRPKTLDEFIGQEHLLGKDKALRKLLAQKKIFSMILWGPPGSGKTTLAKLIADLINADFYQISAVSSGVKEIREIIQIAEENFRKNKYTILFIDEIHRFNKAQQDSLLHSIESGIITLIGATTENPSFEIIPPLLSRCRIYVLKQHSDEDLRKILRQAISKDSYLNSLKIEFIDEDFLIRNSNGDARILLNVFEIAVELAKTKGEKLKIDKEIIQEALQQKKIDYDKLGEEHYNLISAFIKSIRGSDPDAAVYYLARLLEGGEDPLFIARRMIILAAEDIGNASPNALVLATTTFQACHFVGMPEARIILSQCATYLASQPKSNASYIAIEKAIDDVRNLPNYPVPLHLRNAPTRLMKELGYGENYKYAHNYDEHFIQENYLPDELKGKQYYFPTDSGQEKTLKDRLKNWWKGKKKY